MIECIEEKSLYKDESMMVFWDNVNYAKNEIESGYAYQSHCYKSITNKTEVDWSKGRFDKSKDDLSNIFECNC